MANGTSNWDVETYRSKIKKSLSGSGKCDKAFCHYHAQQAKVALSATESCLHSHHYTYMYILSRCLVGPTDQAYLSGFYFRIACKSTKQHSFLQNHNLLISAGPQKVRSTHIKQVILVIIVILVSNKMLNLEIFWVHEVLKLHFECSKNSSS